MFIARILSGLENEKRLGEAESIADDNEGSALVDRHVF
jgi:hypothetical protein